MSKVSKAASAKPGVVVDKNDLKKRLVSHWQLYVMLLIPVILTVIYKYIPMYGIQIAFRDYKASRGFTGSEWVGLQWFERFFGSPNCIRMIKNTVLLSFYSLLWSFPIPVVLALMINQLRFKRFKRTVQTVLYAPHFISIMVVCGMIKIFLSPSGGLINLIAGTSIDFLSEASAFRTIYIASGIWQDAGWGIIVYMATLSNIDVSHYEAAKIDGANGWKTFWGITVPLLKPTIIMTFIMSINGTLQLFDESVNLTNGGPANSTITMSHYIYNNTFGTGVANFGYATAMAFFVFIMVGILALINMKVGDTRD